MPNDLLTVRIRFPDEVPAAAGQLAQGFLDHLAALGTADCRAEVQREADDAQDAGTLVVLTVGTPAVLALARGIAAYIAKRATRIEIGTDGKILAGGDGVQHIADAIRALDKRGRK